MAQAAWSAPFDHPTVPMGISSAPSITGATANSTASSKTAYIFFAPSTKNVHRIWCRPGTITTGAIVDVSLQQVDTTVVPATPNGTLVATNTNGALTLVTGDANTPKFVTLTADAPLVALTPYALVFTQPGSSFGNMQWSMFDDDSANTSAYTLVNNGSWAAVTGNPIFALEYDDATYEFIDGVWPVTLPNTTTISSATNPNHWGALFQFAAPVTLFGCYTYLDADGPFAVIAVDASYDGTNGILATTGVLPNQVRRANTGVFCRRRFTTRPTIPVNTPFRLLIKPSSTTGLTVYDATYDSLGIMNAANGGTNFCLTTAQNPTGNASFKNYNNGTDGYKKPFIGLRISQVDNGAAITYTGGKYSVAVG